MDYPCSTAATSSSIWLNCLFKRLIVFLPDVMQGKLIEIHFSTTGKICGALIQTCKSPYRVCFLLNFFVLTLTDFSFLSWLISNLNLRAVLLEKVRKLSSCHVWTLH